jgi:hypothetical protein
MEDITTVVEFVIEPVKLYEIIQSWATEAKFSIYEKNEKRTIYSKNIRFNTAWLLIENQGENTKLNAWLAPRGMQPDAKGSTWSGWKIAVPNGFAIGPVSIYKKQFNKLMEMLKSKSKNIVMSQSNQRGGKNQQKIEKGTYVKGLAFIGIIEFLLGMLSTISASTFISSFPAVGNVTLINGIFNMVLGILTFTCSRLLKNGKALAIWLYSAAILINVAYEIAMGHKFPYFSMLIGAFIIWQLLTFKKEWELS